MANTYTEQLQVKGNLTKKDNENKLLADKNKLLEVDIEELKKKQETLITQEELEKKLSKVREEADEIRK